MTLMGRFRPPASLFLFALLFIFTVLKSPLDIVLVGGWVEHRDEILSVTKGVLLLLSLLLLMSNGAAVFRAVINWKEGVSLIIIFSFPVAVSIHGILNDAPLGLYTRLTWLLIVCVSYTTFRCYAVPRLCFFWVYRFTYILSSVVVILLAAYFVKNGYITYSYSSIFGVMRPQIGTLLQSTEQSNILAALLLFGTGVWSVSNSRRAKIQFCIATIPIAFLFVLMGSVGSWLCIVFAVGFLYLANLRGNKLITVVFAGLVLMTLAVVLVSCLSSHWRFIEEVTAKLMYDRRNNDYVSLISMIKSEPVAGNGIYAVVDTLGAYPHHNILGLWAERGVFPMLTYLATFFLCVKYSLRIRKLLVSRRNMGLAKLAASFCMIALFLHFKGFVHDTWMDWTMWMSTAAMIGMTENLYVNFYRDPCASEGVFRERQNSIE